MDTSRVLEVVLDHWVATKAVCAIEQFRPCPAHPVTSAALCGGLWIRVQGPDVVRFVCRDRRRLEFSGYHQGDGLDASRGFVGMIGTLVPIVP